MKYQSSSTHCSKIISKIKVSEWTELQNDRQDKKYALRSTRKINLLSKEVYSIYTDIAVA